MPVLTSTIWLVLFVLVLSLYVQTITGFAFSLLFLGFVGVFELMPIAVAADAATLIALIQTAFFLRQEGVGSEWKLIRPAVFAAAPGVAMGVALLYWLGETQRLVLQMLLGVVIVTAAALMLIEVRKQSSPSGSQTFRVAGLLSGIMGGLFSAAGPPIVYLLYRQPLALKAVRHSLFLMFGAIQSMRLIYVLVGGHLEVRSIVFAGLSVPLAFLVTHFASRYPLPLSAFAFKRLAAVLLVATGLSLVISALL